MNNSQYPQYPSHQPYPPPGMPPHPAKAPGKNMLLVTGILFIIFNAIGFFATAIVILTTDYWLWEFGGQAMRDAWMIIYTVDILLSLSAIAIGIMGVALCNKIEKGGMLLICAIILMVFSIIYNVIYIAVIINFDAAMGFGGVIGIPIGLIVPIIFIVGASRNKKAADAAPYSHHDHHRGY